MVLLFPRRLIRRDFLCFLFFSLLAIFVYYNASSVVSTSADIGANNKVQFYNRREELLDSNFNPLKTAERIRHNFDIYSTPRLLSCQGPALEVVDFKLEKQPRMTVPFCVKLCKGKGTTFAALAEGSSCYCLNQHGFRELEKDSECDIACSGDANQTCGGKGRWQFYKIDSNDGERGWTIWMSFGWEASSRKWLRTRYTGCSGDKYYKVDCMAELATSTTKLNLPAEWAALSGYYIGCFTVLTWNHTASSSFTVHSIVVNVTQNSMVKCHESCKAVNSTYTVVMINRCVCANSLGWSRPIDTCVYKVGALVFKNDPFKPKELNLKFEGRRPHKKVAVVAHYRGGSTFTSLMFSSYPGALYIFEPGSIFGVSWRGAAPSLASEHERSSIFLERIYPLWFECSMTDLPARYFTRYPEWGEKNTGFDEFKECKKKVPRPYGPYMCSPMLEEKCFMSPIVAAKTTRIINAENVRKFTLAAPDIEFLHSIRDPRAMLLSRAKLESWYRTNQSFHLETTCWELNNLRNLFEDPNRPANLHHLHYEDMAKDAEAVAQSLYKSIGIAMPSEVSDSLYVATGHGDIKKRKHAFDTVQKDPTSRINAWATVANKSEIERGENTPECKKFFSVYSEYYKSLSTILNELKKQT